MRPSLFLRRLGVAALPLALLIPLAGCGEPADADAAGVAPTATVTLTGPAKAPKEVALDCGVYSDRGLQLTLADTYHGAREEGHDDPQVQIQLRANDYVSAGEYQVGVVIYEHGGHGPQRKWTGSARANIQNQRRTEGLREFSGLSGSFEGTYEGPGGQGTIRGTFQGCTPPELVP